MNQRENFFAMIEGKKPEFIPNSMEVYKSCIAGTCITDSPLMGGVDSFGVNWVATKEGAMPEPNKFLFDEIADWKEHVHFADLDSLGIEAAAAKEMEDFNQNNRNELVVNVFSACGLFERMAAFMGFENALCSLVEDPDSCREFFEALADYRIACHNRFIDAYQPDVLTYFDDLATANGLFMSPKVYREVIKPSHQRIVEAVTSRGVIFSQHTCGKCEEIVGDYVEMGARIWHSAQSMNDLEGIQEKYNDRLIIEGGWDSSGPASYIGASTEDLIEEAKRCANVYGQKGNFILMPTLLNENGNSLFVGDPRLEPMLKAFNEINKL
ncbi:MAG: uroporphyrinogen-III decarboxylase [Acetobacterium woodii]|nr:uroporphyrinogen-III decarboxylase [Acetobacterium woodii]